MKTTPEGGSRANERGSVLALALAFSAIVGSLIVASITVAMLQSRSVEFAVNSTGALSMAEGITELAKKQMLQELADFKEPSTAGNFNLGGRSHPWTAAPIGPAIYRTDPDGVTVVVTPYEISASVQEETGFATVNQVVDLTLTPLFQFMIFFDDDLEILPGPNMQLEGRVHANGNIYVGAGNTLTVDTDYFRSTGTIQRNRKNDGAATGGTVDIRKFGTTDFTQMTNTMDSDNADWTQLALDTWGGTVQDGSHGITEIVAPNMGTITQGGYYHENAELVIVDGLAFDTNGNQLPMPAGVIKETTMYDAREGTNITVTEVDMELLNSSGFFPTNGLVYAYRTDTTSSQPNGIRLTNGAELAAPLSVVSEDPVYVHGDYNTVDKKGAAIICDAINLLSNAWDNSKGPGQLPGASQTTYNFAMITGNVRTPDGGGAYSGGFENLPRFHENWSGWRRRSAAPSRTCTGASSPIPPGATVAIVTPPRFGTGATIPICSTRTICRRSLRTR